MKLSVRYYAQILAVIGLAVGVTDVTQADLLSNGNLDLTAVSGQTLATPVDWVAGASKSVSGPFNDAMSSEGWAGPAPTPVTVGDMGLFFKPFQGDATNAVSGFLYQDVPATPGLSYTLTGWAGAEANYSGLIPDTQTQSQFILSFFDASSSLLGSTVLDLEANGLGVANGEAFSYREFTLSAMAPAGAATVRAEVAMLNAYANPAGGGQAFVVDDFTLVVPEPTTLALTGLGLAALIGLRRHS